MKSAALPRVLVMVAAVAGVVLRIYVYRSALGGADSDEAVLGLMVRHAAHGQVTTFLWGVAYGGTLEVLLTVPVFWLAGSSLLALRVVPLALDVATALLIWRAGRRLVGERPAVFAAALYWLWPAWSVYQHVHQFGFYASDTFFSALILLLTLRAKEAPTAGRVGVLGLGCGVAVYETLQIVPIVAAALVWLAWREPRALRQAWAAVLLAVAGVLPASSGMRGTGGRRFTSSPARASATPTVSGCCSHRCFPRRSACGSSTRSGGWCRPCSARPRTWRSSPLFVYGAWRSRKQDVMLLYLTAAVFPFVYALSEKATASSDPRYTLVLAPCLVSIVAQVMSTPPRAAAVLGVALLLTTVGLLRADDWRKPTPASVGRAPRATWRRSWRRSTGSACAGPSRTTGSPTASTSTRARESSPSRTASTASSCATAMWCRHATPPSAARLRGRGAGRPHGFVFFATSCPAEVTEHSRTDRPH